MDLPSGINLAASLVTILGTTLTIAQALHHRPAAYRQDAGIPPGYASPAYPAPAYPAPAYPSQTPHAPPARRKASTRASTRALQGRQPIVRTGIDYGAGLGVAISIVALTGTWLLDAAGWGRTGFAPTQEQLALVVLTLAAVLSLFIAAGLVPARRVGSAVAGLIAGGIVAVVFDVATAAITTQMYPGTTLGDNVREGIAPSLIGFVVSVICAFLGRWTYHRTASREEAAVGSSVE